MLYLTISEKLYNKLVEDSENCLKSKIMVDCTGSFGDEHKINTDDLIDAGLGMMEAIDHLDKMAGEL